MKQRCRILLKAIAEFLDLVARSGRFLLVLGRSCGEGERKEERGNRKEERGKRKEERGKRKVQPTASLFASSIFSLGTLKGV